MSELDQAMEEHIAFIVFHEKRPFCYKDFLCFDVGGKQYHMKHKTFRNKVCKLKKKGIIELDFNSGIAFYTLKGHRFGKTGTHNHAAVIVSHNDPLYQMFKNLPMGKRSIHDIRLRFFAGGIYSAFCLNTKFPKDERNKDIRLPYWNVLNAIVQVRIHKTNTVSIIISCSREPFLLDYNGIIGFFTTLARIQGLLRGMMLSTNPSMNDQNQIIPDYGKWFLTMWHFGRDALETYKGEKFERTVEDAQGVLARIYTKDFNDHKKIRMEVQECPNKTVIDSIQEKLNNPNLNYN
jgi:hypothetical protein